MKIIFLTMLFAAGTCRAAADDLAGPVSAFVREIFSYEDWNQMEWKVVNLERKDPYGGYLFRFSLKFAPEDNGLIFVASERFGDRFSPAWNIYMTTAEGRWKKIHGGETINHEAFYVDSESRTIIQRYPERIGEGESYSTLNIAIDGSIRKRSYRNGEMDEATRNVLDKMGTRTTPPIEKVPIAAYLRNPGVSWRPFDQSHGTRSQSLDDGDAGLLEGNRDLEFTAAKELVKQLPQDLVESNSPTPGKNLNDDAGSSPKDRQRAVTYQTRSALGATSTVKWLTIGIPIVAAIGLVWMLSKWRKN